MNSKGKIKTLVLSGSDDYFSSGGKKVLIYYKKFRIADCNFRFVKQMYNGFELIELERERGNFWWRKEK